MKKLFFLSLLVFPSYAFAQQDLPPECRVLEQHKPSSDATYQPGVDVNGNPVAPADINSPSSMGLNNQTIVIPLSIDMAKRLQGMNIAGLDMTSTLGFIEVAPNGHVTYNGQDLTGQVQVLCDQNAQNPPSSADGQGKPDAVEYPPVKKKPKGTPAPKPVTPVLKTPEAKPEPKKEPEQGELLQGGEYR